MDQFEFEYAEGQIEKAIEAVDKLKSFLVKAQGYKENWVDDIKYNVICAQGTAEGIIEELDKIFK